MNKGILTGGLLCIGLATLTGCAGLGADQPGAFDTSSMILSAAPDNRGNASRNADRGNERGNSDVDLDINIGFEEARRLAVANNLTGYDALPPGIRRNLARGKPLPPGIAKRAVPSGMLDRLPVMGGHEWQVSGTDLVLVEAGTMLVVEILAGVFE